MQGTDIKTYLEKNGIKQNFLAEKAGIAPSIINHILNNKRKIEANEYMRICGALDLPLDFFGSKLCAPEEKGV